MKLKSLIMFSAAALAFAACSNDEENGGIKGDATVTVNVQDAISRAIETPSTGNNGDPFDVQINTITLTLEAASGQQTTTDVQSSGTYTFLNVRGPQSITVSINGGVPVGQMEMTTERIQSGLAEPLYASSTTFTQSGNNYSVTLQPEHRLARLQFSGIQHVDEGNCLYSSLTFDGLYLNGVRESEANSTLLTANTSGSAWNVASAWKLPYYDWAGAGNEGVVIVGEGAVTAPLPATGCYAYNIIPANKPSLPILTLAFSNAAQTNPVVGETGYRYASVKTYLLDDTKGALTGAAATNAGVDEETGEIVAFKAGYIYDITNLKYADSDLGPDPTGEVGTLIATVEVKKWTLVNGTVEWNK